MRQTIEKITCDIKDCKDEMSKQFANVVDVQVIFTTEQTEGKTCEAYPQLSKLDLCPVCKKRWLNGNPIFAYGAMGYNTYYFKS